MNMAFIMVVSFGILIFVIFVATAIFNAKVGSSSQPAPWMRRVRQFQDEKANAGWRIQLIPYDDTSKPMTINLDGLWSIVPMLGAMGFLGGLALATYTNSKHQGTGLVIAVLSFMVAFGVAWLKSNRVEQGWDFAPGRCVDRELQKIWIPAVAPGGGGHWGWFWRIICEYEYLGIRYRVAPQVYGAGFGSEAAALKFLEERISQNGECTLRINPKNLLQTELLEQRAKTQCQMQMANTKFESP